VSAVEHEVYADADELASTAARRALEVLQAAAEERGVAHLVVTGGGILERTLAAMAVPEALDWSKVHVWWGDERYVPAGSDDRNDRPAMAKLFDRVPYEPTQLHRMPAAEDVYPDAEDAADAYAQELRSQAPQDGDVPAFDVVLLGVGPDGHCASLFPGHPGTRVLDASVIAVHDSPKPPPTRLSLTFPALDAARQVWFIASGESKAEAVARALGGAPREEVPSAGPRGRERTLWLLDRDAASRL
jgi:6-phosphogluconolactonase